LPQQQQQQLLQQHAHHVDALKRSVIADITRRVRHFTSTRGL
jgi:hypothetical protein